jgi:hypothetical protein
MPRALQRAAMVYAREERSVEPWKDRHRDLENRLRVPERRSREFVFP